MLVFSAQLCDLYSIPFCPSPLLYGSTLSPMSFTVWRNSCTYTWCVSMGEGGIGLCWRQITSGRKVPFLVIFQIWRHFELPSLRLIFLRFRLFIAFWKLAAKFRVEQLWTHGTGVFDKIYLNALGCVKRKDSQTCLHIIWWEEEIYTVKKSQSLSPIPAGMSSRDVTYQTLSSRGKLIFCWYLGSHWWKDASTEYPRSFISLVIRIA